MFARDTHRNICIPGRENSFSNKGASEIVLLPHLPDLEVVVPFPKITHSVPTNSWSSISSIWAPQQTAGDVHFSPTKQYSPVQGVNELLEFIKENKNNQIIDINEKYNNYIYQKYKVKIKIEN